jgi:hypothetical protein
LRQPCPHCGRGRMRYSELPKIPIQVIQHYREPGRHSGGALAPGASVFSGPKRIPFFHCILDMQFLRFFTFVNLSLIQVLKQHITLF